MTQACVRGPKCSITYFIYVSLWVKCTLNSFLHHLYFYAPFRIQCSLNICRCVRKSPIYHWFGFGILRQLLFNKLANHFPEPGKHLIICKISRESSILNWLLIIFCFLLKRNGYHSNHIHFSQIWKNMTD